MFKMQLQRNVLLWIAVFTGAILSIPLASMQFTDEVNWGLADFVVMGLLVFSASYLLVIVSGLTHQRHKVVIAAVVIAAFIYIWAELAVGVVTGIGS